MKLIVTILLNIKKNGFFKTLFKIIKYPYNKFKFNKLEKKIFSTNSIEDRFTKIFKLNYWGNNESVSGGGSSLASTKNITHKLPQLINQFKVTSILDAPCGDFYWMAHVMKNLKIKYLGGDIVTKIINENNNKYRSDIINFRKINIISDKLPDSDLMICRDCLFHFSYEDIFKFFENFINSNIRILLTTSHSNDYSNDKFLFKNKNILTGDYRKIDLFSEPFNFKKNYLLSIEDKDESYVFNHKFLYLFSRKQISEFIKIKNSEHNTAN